MDYSKRLANTPQKNTYSYTRTDQTPKIVRGRFAEYQIYQKN
jgi:hypothetical protein